MKYVRRHRGAVAAAAAIVLVLAGGLAASAYQARLAQARLQQVRSLADALVFDVHDAVRDLPGATQARALIVKTGGASEFPARGRTGRYARRDALHGVSQAGRRAGRH
jgi:hypothetical protein